VPERSLQIRVRVYRQRGALLSRLAHDLELSLERFQFGESGTTIKLRFRPDALRVVGALVNGKVDSELLSPDKRREIEQNVQTQVLNTKQFPEADFMGSFSDQGDAVFVTGDLKLVGVTQRIEFTLTQADPGHLGSITLTPSRWGVRPFQALLGALKLEDRVDIIVEVQSPPNAG
jgi:polyisoprenoid-binding protein YceI